MVLLSYRLVVLHEQHTSVVARHECRRELGLSVVFLSRQYVYGELHHLIAASGVGVRGEERAVVHEFHASAILRHGVDAADFYVREVESVLFGGASCAHCHAVVMSKHTVELVVRFREQRVDGAECALLSPVGVQLFHNAQSRSASHQAVEALLALYRRRRRRESAQLQYASTVGECARQIFAHRTAYLLVVCADIRRVLVRPCASVEDNHRYALFVCAVYRRRYAHLTRRHDEQVYTLVHELVYLFGLQLHVVVSRTDAQVYIVVVECGDA